MERIRLVSRILRIVFLAIIVLTPVIHALIWFNLDRLNPVELAQLYPSIPFEESAIKAPLTAGIKTLGFIVTMIPAGIHMVAFFLIFRLFGLYARGEIFTEGSVGSIRKAGYALLASQLIGPLHDALITFVLTMHNPPGMRSISIGIGSTEISGIIVACMVILVAWVMDEGRKLKEEEALVI